MWGGLREGKQECGGETGLKRRIRPLGRSPEEEQKKALPRMTPSQGVAEPSQPSATTEVSLWKRGRVRLGTQSVLISQDSL